MVSVTFDIAPASPKGDTPITFDDSGSLADASARPLEAQYGDGVVTISATYASGLASTFFGYAARCAERLCLSESVTYPVAAMPPHPAAEPRYRGQFSGKAELYRTSTGKARKDGRN